MAYDIEFTWQAKTAIDSLDPGEREEVARSIDRLRHGPKPPGVPEVRTLRGPKNISVLRGGRGQRLHILFTVEPGDHIRIQDLVTHDLVQEYRRSVAQ
ncbi:MAG TPA: hypothetical protein VM008_22620 [Phycisphaerae bacterium]|nr:hypothetical protein [Phycisphaerae bacterium]